VKLFLDICTFIAAALLGGTLVLCGILVHPATIREFQRALEDET